jgi:Fe2+ or Zn2+ uptake regulation protein
MNFKEFAVNKLKENGLKITNARCCVLDILGKSKKSLNAYEIAALSKKMKLSIDTSTVYRILEAYQKLGLIHFVKEQNGYLCCKDFECNKQKHCHHQLVCEKCHKVEEIHLDDTDFLKSIRAKNPKFQIQNHYFEFLGKCSSCNK